MKMSVLVLTATLLNVFKWIPGLCYGVYTMYHGGSLLQGLLAFVTGYCLSWALGLLIVYVAMALNK